MYATKSFAKFFKWRKNIFPMFFHCILFVFYLYWPILLGLKKKGGNWINSKIMEMPQWLHRDKIIKKSKKNSSDNYCLNPDVKEHFFHSIDHWRIAVSFPPVDNSLNEIKSILILKVARIQQNTDVPK